MSCSSHLAFTLLLFGAVLPGGCARRSPSEPLLRDGLGRAVRPAPSGRLISLAPSSTEILFALGVGDRVVGVDRYSDWPLAARAIERVGGDVDPSLERILALRPALVFTATSANSQRTTEALERTNIPVFVSRAARLTEIYADIERIGEAVGRSAEAAHLVASLKERMAALRRRTASRRRPSVVVVVWPAPLVVASDASHLGDLIAAAGGENQVQTTVAFPSYSIERLVRAQPEVVVVGTHGNDAPLATLERLPPSLRSRHLRFIDGDLLFRPGPRVVDGAAALAEALAAKESSP